MLRSLTLSSTPSGETARLSKMLQASSISSPLDLFDKKILVVDDYTMTREMIVEALQQSGYRSIKQANNGEEALKILKDGDFDLVISDVMMPRMNGMDLLQSVKELNPTTAIIMMTGQPATDMTVAAMKGGAVDFIKKPFNINDLLYKVQIYLREKCLMEAADVKEKASRQDLSERTKELSIKSYIYDSLENLEGDNDEIFEKLAEIATRITGVDVCRIVIYDAQNGDFYLKVYKGVANYDNDKDLSLLTPFFKQVIEKREALVIHGEDHPAISPSLICVPLTIRNQAFGVLSVRRKKHMGVFQTRDLHYLTSLAKRASLNLENMVLYESLYANVLDTFKSLIASIQLRDHYTEKHSMRVTDNAVKIALAMGCSAREIQTIKIAGPLHDIGKIAIPDSILLKPNRLSDEEYQIIKTHADIGAQIISSIALFDTEREVILHHHERWDGRGYPARIGGEDIPLLARIIAVADTFDAITNNRPYRSAQGRAWAVDQLKIHRNLQFDGRIVDHFLDILERDI